MKDRFKQFWNKHRIGIITIVLMMVVAMVYCLSKRTFETDEPLSFALANGVSGWVTLDLGWTEKATFKYYGVLDRPFDFSIAYRNQYFEVHPPLYYYLLHFICSFFPYRFSIWFGLSINLLSLLLCYILVYRIICVLTDKPALGSLGVILFGLHHLTVYGLLFIRMYMLSALFVLLFLNFAINIIQDEKIRFWSFIGLAVSTVGGGLTHYHFYFIIGCLSLMIAIYLLFKRDYLKLLLAFLTAIGSGLLNIFIFFPGTLYHLTDPGNQHIIHAESSVFSLNADHLSYLINRAYGWPVFIGMVVLLAFISYYAIGKKKADTKMQIAGLVLSGDLLAFLLIANTTDIIHERYYVPTLALAFIGIVIAMDALGWFDNRRGISAVILGIILLLNLNIKQLTDNLFTKPSWQFAEEHQYGVAMVVADDPFAYYHITEVFADLRWYWATGVTQIGIPFSHTVTDDFVLYIEDTLNQDVAIDYIQGTFPAGTDLIFNQTVIPTSRFTVYEVFVND